MLRLERGPGCAPFETAEQIVLAFVIRPFIVIFFQLGAHLFFDYIDSRHHIERRITSGQGLVGHMHNDIAFVFIAICPIDLAKLYLNSY